MKKVFFAFVFSVVLFSCKKDEEEIPMPAPGVTDETGYLHGKFVINEGSFLSNNASISYINASNAVTNDVYLQVNAVELGDVLQSFAVIGERGYAVLNNSQRVEVVNMRTMQHVTDFTVDYPRHILSIGGEKAYVTNGSGMGVVKVVNTTTNTITSEIPVGLGPERMLQVEGKVLVMNNGYGAGNSISVIDIATDAVVNTITLSDGPAQAIRDANGKVWVLCSGQVLYDDMWNVIGHSSAVLYKLDGTNFSQEAYFTIGSEGDHPGRLSVSPDGNTIYYLNNGLYAFSASDDTATGVLLISDNCTSIDIDPATGDIWSAGISDFMNPSWVYHYTSTGSLIDSLEVGIGASGVVFN